jgi:hypothetical protein
VVKVSKAEPSHIRIGDIVAFQDGQNVVVHRVIGKSWSNRQLRFRHRGDAGRSSGIVQAQNLIGRVSVIQKAGREIHLSSPRYVIGNKIFSWRLQFLEALGHIPYLCVRRGLRKAFRSIWLLCQASVLALMKENR